jgi:hypothetical protein
VGAEHLTVSVSTLKTIQKARNANLVTPEEIATEIIWSSCSELFSFCSCILTSTSATSASALLGQDHSQHDPIQLFLPMAKAWKILLEVPKIHPGVDLNSLGDNGAVLFGHTLY